MRLFACISSVLRLHRRDVPAACLCAARKQAPAAQAGAEFAEKPWSEDSFGFGFGFHSKVDFLGVLCVSAVKKCFALALVAVVGMGAFGQGFVGGDVLFELAGSARSVGMGGAGLAAPDGDALFLNPAGLPWVEGVQVLSAYGSQFGAADLGLLSLAVPGLAAAGIFLDAGPIGPDLAFRTEGAVLGMGLRIGPLAAGVRARVLRPVAPVPSLGGALDFGLLWRGPIHLGAVWRGVVSQPHVPGEIWPPNLAVGLAVPVDLGGLTMTLAFDLLGIGQAPTFAVGGEVGGDWITIRAGYGGGGLALGGSVRWALFVLDWAIVVHPVLPAAFRVSLTVRL